MVADPYSSSFKASTRSALMRHFNQSFPPFYSQFVSSEVQVQNLRLAYTLYQTRKAVVQIVDERKLTVIYFAYTNQPYMLSDIVGVLTAFNLTIHGLNLYGQIYSPHLVCMRMIVSRNNQALPPSTRNNLERAIHECLAGNFQVHESLSIEFDLTQPLQQARVEYYFDQVFHLPAILIDADNEPGLFYKVAYALWKEDLTVINVNLIVRREQTRLIFYLLGPNAMTALPDYLGQKIVQSLRQRIGGCAPPA
ncbi:MAG: hypothetical protein HC921_04405 [Synechococcaceae cyanobacterium SM2_3_1]|nr:hypothetical protein [Synechococcaceae cyanobacterium SM2_3_1]